MKELLEKVNPQYIVDEKGQKTAVVIDFNKYKNLLEFIEDLEDSIDLTNAELEATDFTPYEKFRKRWLNN
ncbi:MAG: hypothetical protein ACUZ8O_01660 [Candidatus Anammoxibacter sp.]